jgi:hypothetical protein
VKKKERETKMKIAIVTWMIGLIFGFAGGAAFMQGYMDRHPRTLLFKMEVDGFKGGERVVERKVIKQL